MQYNPAKAKRWDPDKEIYQTLEPIIHGLGMSLLELSVYRGKARGAKPGNVQVKIAVLADKTTGISDCSRVHRKIIPLLETFFPGQELSLEVSSPGVDRLIKTGIEFKHYIGFRVKCYCTDISDWINGILLAADEKGITLETDGQKTSLAYEIIGKAQLNVPAA